LLLIASPGYLRRQGTPSAPADLAAHRHIVFRMHSSGRDRPQQFGVRGRTLEMHPRPWLRCNDGEAMVQAAALGLGLAQVPDNMAQAALDAGRVVEVLPRHRPPATPIHAVMPGNRLLPARVRALLDLLGTIAEDAPPPRRQRRG
jgi:LysR family transcriptional regulator, regulator for bpeEF and oprC